MPSCTSIDALVTPYVDGELGTADQAALERHVGLCPRCRSRIDAERAVRDLLTERKPALCVRAPDTLRMRCAQAVQGDQAAPTFIGVTTRPWSQRLAPLAAAATLVLIVGGA